MEDAYHEQPGADHVVRGERPGQGQLLHGRRELRPVRRPRLVDDAGHGRRLLVVRRPHPVRQPGVGLGDLLVALVPVPGDDPGHAPASRSPRGCSTTRPRTTTARAACDRWRRWWRSGRCDSAPTDPSDVVLQLEAGLGHRRDLSAGRSRRSASRTSGPARSRTQRPRSPTTPTRWCTPKRSAERCLPGQLYRWKVDASDFFGNAGEQRLGVLRHQRRCEQLRRPDGGRRPGEQRPRTRR